MGAIMNELAVQQHPHDLAALRLNGTIDIGKPPAKIPHELMPPAILEWLASARDRSPNTEDAYHRAMSSWLAWCLAAAVNPHDARRADAEAWRRWMKTETPTHKAMAERTANLRIAACSALYRRLLAEQEVARNPFETVIRDRVATNHLQTPALSEGQSHKLMTKALADKEHLAHRAVIEILFTTAARAFEVAAANLGDLEPDEFGMTLWVTRKGGKRQQLPITPDALKAINAANTGRRAAAFERGAGAAARARAAPRRPVWRKALRRAT